MIQLNTEASKKAWEDFKAHLIDCEILKEVDINTESREYHREKNRQATLKMAFKQGFAMAAELSNKEVAAESAEVKVIMVEKPEKKKITRKIENRMNRDNDVIFSDNEKLERILKHRGKPMPLYRIIDRMKAAGSNHWNQKNASGFIIQAIKRGVQITKVKRGVYVYSGPERKDKQL